MLRWDMHANTAPRCDLTLNFSTHLMDIHLTSEWHEHKATVTQGLLALVEADRASWHVSSMGKLELHLERGQIYQIGRGTVTRIA
jgi:hypothetical protein